MHSSLKMKTDYLAFTLRCHQLKIYMYIYDMLLPVPTLLEFPY